MIGIQQSIKARASRDLQSPGAAIAEDVLLDHGLYSSRCSVWNSQEQCSATVLQRGDTFIEGQSVHSHEPKQGTGEMIGIQQSIKARASRDLQSPGAAITEDVLLDHGLYSSRCSVWNSQEQCSATVLQRGDTFIEWQSVHSHEPKQGTGEMIGIQQSIKARASRDLQSPGAAIAEDVLLDHGLYSSRCSVWNSQEQCSATVLQRGDTFIEWQSVHSHEPKQGTGEMIGIQQSIKARASRDLQSPGAAIAEDVLLDHGLYSSRCSVWNSQEQCSATVHQRGDTFIVYYTIKHVNNSSFNAGFTHRSQRLHS